MKRSGHAEGKVASLPLSSIAQSTEDDSSSVAATRSRTSSYSYDNRSQSKSSSSDSEESTDKEEIIQRVQKLRDTGMRYEDRMWKLAEPPRKKTAWDYMLDEITKTSELFKERRIRNELARAKLSEELAINSLFQAIIRQKTENRKKVEGGKRISDMVLHFWNLQYERSKEQTSLPESEKPIKTSPKNRLGVDDILQGVEDEIDLRAALSVQSEANEFLEEFDENFGIDCLEDVEVTLPKAEKDIRSVSKITPLQNFALRTIKSCFEDCSTEMQNNKENMEAIRKINLDFDFVEIELLDFQRRSKIQKLIMNWENAVAHLPKIGTENSVRVSPVPGVNDFYVDPCLGYLYNREIAPKSESVPSAPATKLIPKVSKYHLLLKNTLNDAGISSTQGPLLHAGPSSFPSTSAVNEQNKNPAMKRDRKNKARESFLAKLKKIQQLTGAEEGVPVSVSPKPKPLRAINFRSPRCLTIGVENPGPWKPGKPGRDIFGACSCIYCLND